VKTILKASGDRYKKLRAEHGDHVDHYSPVVREPVANTEAGFVKKDNSEEINEHEETVNAEGLLTSEVDRDRVDEMLSRIGVFDPATESADDLQKLQGVGPLMEQRLHQMGIYTYGQVSRLTNEDINLLDSTIENFPIEENRGDWRVQANKLKN